MALLDALFGRRATLDVGYPRQTGKSNGVTIDASDWPDISRTDVFMSAVERRRRQDRAFMRAGLYNHMSIRHRKITVLTPLQKTAYAYWRDTTDLEFPGAKPIEIEILRELRRLNAKIPNNFTTNDL